MWLPFIGGPSAKGRLGIDRDVPLLQQFHTGKPEHHKIGNTIYDRRDLISRSVRKGWVSVKISRSSRARVPAELGFWIVEETPTSNNSAAGRRATTVDADDYPSVLSTIGQAQLGAKRRFTMGSGQGIVAEAPATLSDVPFKTFYLQ